MHNALAPRDIVVRYILKPRIEHATGNNAVIPAVEIPLTKQLEVCGYASTWRPRGGIGAVIFALWYYHRPFVGFWQLGQQPLSTPFEMVLALMSNAESGNQLVCGNITCLVDEMPRQSWIATRPQWFSHG